MTDAIWQSPVPFEIMIILVSGGIEISSKLTQPNGN